MEKIQNINYLSYVRRGIGIIAAGDVQCSIHHSNSSSYVKMLNIMISIIKRIIKVTC